MIDGWAIVHWKCQIIELLRKTSLSANSIVNSSLLALEARETLVWILLALNTLRKFHDLLVWVGERKSCEFFQQKSLTQFPAEHLERSCLLYLTENPDTWMTDMSSRVFPLLISTQPKLFLECALSSIHFSYVRYFYGILSRRRLIAPWLMSGGDNDATNRFEISHSAHVFPGCYAYSILRHLMFTVLSFVFRATVTITHSSI